MTETRCYRPRPDRPVAAVQLNLETEGLRYRKWGDDQFAPAGDWLVDNDGDIYTVAAATFARTYRAVGRGVYVKTTCVWARRAEAAGRIATQEGSTGYEAGDYLVSNNEDGSDAWAISPEKFESRYEPDA